MPDMRASSALPALQRDAHHSAEPDECRRLEGRALAHLIGTPVQAGLFEDDKQHLTLPVRLKGRAGRTLESVWRCLCRPCTVAWHGHGQAGREAAAEGQGGGAACPKPGISSRGLNAYIVIQIDGGGQ